MKQYIDFETTVQTGVGRRSHVQHLLKLYRSCSHINLHYSFHLVNKQINIVILIPKVNCNCWLLFANMRENQMFPQHSILLSCQLKVCTLKRILFLFWWLYNRCFTKLGTGCCSTTFQLENQPIPCNQTGGSVHTRKNDFGPHGGQIFVSRWNQSK